MGKGVRVWGYSQPDKPVEVVQTFSVGGSAIHVDLYHASNERILETSYHPDPPKDPKHRTT